MREREDENVSPNLLMVIIFRNGILGLFSALYNFIFFQPSVMACITFRNIKEQDPCSRCPSFPFSIPSSLPSFLLPMFFRKPSQTVLFPNFKLPNDFPCRGQACLAFWVWSLLASLASFPTLFLQDSGLMDRSQFPEPGFCFVPASSAEAFSPLAH